MKTYTTTKDNKEIKVKEYDDGTTYHYDENNNLIHYKDSYGYEYWREYDSNCNLIYHKDSNGLEYWSEYDENNNEIHYKNTDGLEYWREYDENNNKIHYKDSKRYEYWKEYDENDNEIYYKDTNGNEDFYINRKKVSKEEWLNHNTNFQYKYLYDVILTLKEGKQDVTLENIKNNLHNIKINNIERKFNTIKNIFI